MSNFVPARVMFEGHFYSSTEHAYQAAKTLDETERLNIRLAKTAGIAKSMGGKVKLREDWEEIKDEVMLDLLIQKFAQEPFKSQLLLTKRAYLEETNHWGDTYWGVCNGVGKNKLGHLLMQVRAMLQELEGSTHGA